ncbi:serine hydrolase [Isoptericola variabilis]|uniref:Beta-lactamase n=1 Tax=Isoptericola variabilis (strain 225) TaxID=743718 RepID=F6FTL6_ISOV2|nr:serine hydrolase domain-containing protein [Isoptericola variabilis]AEG43209.1 beta-lactamase [Isoptericola variabilis 225]TWH35144.1 CubicO group peptidase (beta-lactamase class C family) [Isoptericola variabilis J7]
MGDGRIDELLTRTAEQAARRRVGVVVGHVAPDGTTTVRGAGRARLPDGGTPDARTLFEIGSVTKTFTALVLARAVVEGELSLDTPVGDLVPEVAGLGRDGRLVTLGHLATHTSGLPRTHVPIVRGSLEMLRGKDPYRDVTEASTLAAVRAGRLRRTPGSGRPSYSNSGYALLGVALARHAGTTFGELVRTRVTDPLGLADTRTRHELTEDQAARTARGHHRRRTPAAPWPLDGLPGAGALLSTAADTLAWARAHLDPPDGPLGDAVRLATAEHARRIGLAWQRTPGRGEDTLVWHNGGTGGFRSMVCLRPEAGDAVVVLTNHARGVDLPALSLVRRLPAA